MGALAGGVAAVSAGGAGESAGSSNVSGAGVGPGETGVEGVRASEDGLLPADLDLSSVVGPYLFPDNSRRRVPGGLYVLTGAAGLGAWLIVDDSVLVNTGFALGSAALILIGFYCLGAGWSLAVDENGALVAAVGAVGFPVGHVSARLGWRGLRSRPTWRILLYSNDSPPTQRGIVLVDGIDGEVVAHFVEANPENWADFDSSG